MEDPRAEPPEPKQTVALKKDDIVQAQLKQVLDAVASFRAEVNSGLTHLTADVQLVSNDLGIVKDRVAIIEGWKNDQDARAARNSKRVQQVSESDLAQEAKIAETIVKQQALESAIHETRAMVEPIAMQIQKQSDLMGIGKAGVKWLASSEGRATLLQVAAALYAAIEVLKHGGVHL